MNRFSMIGLGLCLGALLAAPLDTLAQLPVKLAIVHTACGAFVRASDRPPSESWRERHASPVTDVLLVHGIFANGKRMAKMQAALTDTHVFQSVDTIDFGSSPETLSNEAPIASQAKALGSRIRAIVQGGGPNRGIALVCHSMGGLAARYYLQHQELWPAPGHSGVTRLIMMGTPNLGTDVELENPIIAVMVAHLSSPEGHLNDDRDDAWSPAFRDMFAEWQPAPHRNDAGDYVYPKGYRLGRWSHFFGNLVSPMPYTVSAGAAEIALHAAFADASHANDASALQSAVRDFFGITVSQCARIHMDYYTKTAALMGVSVGGSEWGVDARRVSVFLHELNSGTTEPAGVAVYLIAGDENRIPYNVPGTRLEGTIASPYEGAISDGIVLRDSAMGLDPLTGTSLFPNALARTVLHTNHSDLPDFTDCIRQVVDWLNAP
jgi:hypothetical protein